MGWPNNLRGGWRTLDTHGSMQMQCSATLCSYPTTMSALQAPLRAQRKRNEIYPNSEVIVLLSTEHKVSFFLLEDGYIGVYDVLHKRQD